ncbi:hypothetical protein [Zobellella sp. An-6]|uniref:hypothetical protein n=1 Tax=Zobellella sp. An-6 TaxID=3400218 RepID=UPI0040410F06
MRNYRIIIVVVLVMYSQLPAAAAFSAENLDGITVIALADKDAAHVIHGTRKGSDPYLVVYVSAQGNYASVGNRDKRHCVAWAVDGSYTGTSITFGSPATAASINRFPYVCQPFQLSLEANGEVRIQAENPVGRSSPLAADAQVMRYSRRHPVLIRVPLIAIDWGLPLFNTYSLHKVSLGPWPAVTAALAPDSKMSLSALKVNSKRFIVDQTPSDKWSSRRVVGEVMSGERLGWPWDVLFGARLVNNFQKRSTVATFDEAILNRWGTPTQVNQLFGSRRRDHYWLFDLNGQQVYAEARPSQSCLDTKGLWEHQDWLSRIKVDVGPWNCLLIVRLRDDANGQGKVSKYEFEVMNGYAAALNHFSWRLEQVRALREKVRNTEVRKVEL